MGTKYACGFTIEKTHGNQRSIVYILTDVILLYIVDILHSENSAIVDIYFIAVSYFLMMV